MELYNWVYPPIYLEETQKVHGLKKIEEEGWYRIIVGLYASEIQVNGEQVFVGSDAKIRLYLKVDDIVEVYGAHEIEKSDAPKGVNSK